MGELNIMLFLRFTQEIMQIQEKKFKITIKSS